MNNNTVEMAWNEPGQGNNNQSQNPWGKKNKEQGPPDLDQIFRKLQQKIKAFWKDEKRKSFGGGFSSPGGFSDQKWSQILSWVLGVFIVLYMVTGIYIVEPAERAVITRFGKYVRTEDPGLHWLPWFVEAKEIVNVEQMQTSEHKGLMLTQDENIVSVEVVVYYMINDAKAFLFNVVNPVSTLKQAAESALRQVVGHSTLNDVLTSGQIAGAIKQQILATLKNYDAGIGVIDVVLQRAKAPDEVRAAFDDVIKAREEAQRSKNQAYAYANEIIPRAEARASRVRKEAEAYQQEIKLIAEGNTQRFNHIFTQYQKSPKVTHSRMYLDTLAEIFAKNKKIFVDIDQSNNLIYLPIEKLMGSSEKSIDSPNTATRTEAEKN